jgi:hypothetical protein
MRWSRYGSGPPPPAVTGSISAIANMLKDGAYRKIEANYFDFHLYGK